MSEIASQEKKKFKIMWYVYYAYEQSVIPLVAHVCSVYVFCVKETIPYVLVCVVW